MSLKESLLEEFTSYMQKTRPNLRVEKVTGFRDSTRSGGYCDTCWYEYAVIELDVIYENGMTGTEVIEESFSDFISDLTS